MRCGAAPKTVCVGRIGHGPFLAAEPTWSVWKKVDEMWESRRPAWAGGGVHLNRPRYFAHMEPKDILAISGKPGLYKVLNTTHRAIVVEPLGEGKRTAVPASARVSSFEDISIFTYEADLPLAEVLNMMHAHLKGEKAPDAKVPHGELRDFVTQVVQDLDQERVYHSDLKKLCTWYNALAELSLLPFSDEEAGEESPAAEEAAEEAAEVEEEATEGDGA